MFGVAIVALIIINLVGTVALWTRNQNMLFAIYSLSILALFMATVVKDANPEWKTYQRTYKQILLAQESDPVRKEDIQNASFEVKQIWNPALGIADRCITCHTAIDNTDMEKADEPFRYHAEARKHDFQKIGCTICHWGQGRATEKEDAHAYHISHWDYPMWKGKMIQAMCPMCHQELYEPGTQLEGAEMFIKGRDLTERNSLEITCVSCHTIHGQGETMAPDLTEFGSRTEHEFEQTHDMTFVEGEKNMFNWTFQHFINPPKITPSRPETGQEETIMPNFDFTEEEALALTIYVYSLRTSKVPSNYIYHGRAEETRRVTFIEEFQKSITVEELETMGSGEQLYLKYNCWFCHTIKGRGGKLAKDLSHIGSEQPLESLKQTLRDPRATNRHSFMPDKNFTDAQIDQLADFLASQK